MTQPRPGLLHPLHRKREHQHEADPDGEAHRHGHFVQLFDVVQKDAFEGRDRRPNDDGTLQRPRNRFDEFLTPPCRPQDEQDHREVQRQGGHRVKPLLRRRETVAQHQRQHEWQRRRDPAGGKRLAVDYRTRGDKKAVDEGHEDGLLEREAERRLHQGHEREAGGRRDKQSLRELGPLEAGVYERNASRERSPANAGLNRAMFAFHSDREGWEVIVTQTTHVGSVVARDGGGRGGIGCHRPTEKLTSYFSPLTSYFSLLTSH